MKRYNLFIAFPAISFQRILLHSLQQSNGLRFIGFLLIISLFHISSMAEGTPQMQPEPSDGIAPLYINANIDEGGERTNFAGWNNQDEFSRLYINIQDPANECIYIGLGGFNSVYNDNGIKYRIIAPDGEILIERHMEVSNIVGDDNDARWTNASQGPFEITGAGYIAGIHAIHPADFENMDNANQVGDYYIEFTELDDDGNPIGGEEGDDGFWVNHFDITVAMNCEATPVRVNGRVWSYRWEFRTNNGSFEGAFYVCADDEASPATNDGFITLIDFKDADFAPFYFNLIFNREGPGIGQSIGDKRKSRINCDPIGIPEYKAFLNDPDEAICASASFGSPTSPLTLEQCGPTDFCWSVQVDKFGGEFEIFLDLNGELGFQMGTPDVLLSHKIEQGQENTNICIPWNGRNGEGTFLGFEIDPEKVKASYIEGIFHFPVFDAERSNTGFMVEYVRPLPEGCPGDDCPPILIRWDDSEVNGGDCDDSCGTPYQPCPKSIGNACADVQLIGCDPNDDDCKRCWQSSYGDRATLNTFWNVLIQPLEFASAGENYLQVDISGRTSLCRNDDTVLLGADLTPVGSSELTGWKWNGPDGEISSGSTLPIEEIGPLGINDLGEYRLTISFGLACVVNTSTELIKVEPPNSPDVLDLNRQICEGESSLISFEESLSPGTHFFYDEDPALNPGVSPIITGDSYDPNTPLGTIESVWVSFFDGTCESDALEVLIDNNCIADLSITKDDDSPSYIPGTNSTYTIVVSNNGPLDVNGAGVEDLAPSGTEIVNWSAVFGGGANGNSNGIGNISESVNLPNASTITYSVILSIPSNFTGSLTNEASVTAPEGIIETNPNNNTASDTNSTDARTDLSIEKTDNVSSVIAGDGNSYSYLITVTNSGPSDAHNVTVSEDSFPAGFQMGAVTSSQGACGSFPCNLGTITNGESASIFIEYTVPQSSQNSVQINTASVSSDELDLNQSNNTASDNTEILTSSDVEIEKTDNQTAVIAGDGNIYTYTIKVTNNGPSNADNVRVTEDSFPAGFVMGTVSSTQGNCGSFPCNLGALTTGASANIYIQYTVPASTQPSSQSNTVSVSSDEPDPDANNNSDTDNTTVSSEADLAIFQTDNQVSVIAGEGNTYSYDIRVDNVGPSDANNVIVTEDSFPTGFVMGTVSSSQGGCTGFPCNLGTIEAAASANLTIEYTVPSSTLPSLQTNRVSVSSDEVDMDSSDNSASDDTEVLVFSNLGLGISDNREKVTAGDGNIYTYFVRVENNGPSDAQNVTVTEEDFPSGFTMKTVSSSQGDCGGFPCNLGTVVKGASAVILVNYTVPPSTPSSMQTNTVSVISDEPNYFRGQNTATDETLVVNESDLSISKTDGAVNYIPGSTVTYTIELTNGGMSDAFDAQVIDTAPSGTTIESWTADFMGGALGNIMGSGDINETVYIPVGAVIRYTVNVWVPNEFMNVLENTATVEVASFSTDPNPNNNSATDSNNCLPTASCLIDAPLVVLEACELPDPESDPYAVFDIVACQGMITMMTEDIGDIDLCDFTADFERYYYLYIDGQLFGTCSQSFAITCIPESEMACRSEVQISLDESCLAEITPDMILTSEVNCVDRFLVELFYQGELIEGSPWVDHNWVGYTLDVVITDLEFGNTCMSIIRIEDKLPPVFTNCDENVMLACYEELNYIPEVIDNCDGPIIPELIGETKKLNNCLADTDETILKTITRIYQATDSQGNVSLPCTVNIQIKRVMVGEVLFPANWDLADGGHSAIKCDETLVTTIIDGKEVLDPEHYGAPTWNGVDLWLNQGAACNLLVTFEDFELPPINCVSKIMRIWWVREWFCSAENLVNNTAMPQIIEIIDDQGPVFNCPENETYFTNGFSCELQVYIPKPEANDICGEVAQIDMEYPGRFEANWEGGFVTLYNGINTITFYGYDNCENSSTCSYAISIEDHTAPVAVCEEFTVVSVGLDGKALVHAESFDNGSYDDCEIKTMLTRRMDGGCPDCGIPDYNDFDFLGEHEGHYYYLSHYKFRGDKSFKIASAMGGYVLSINSHEEASWVNGKVRSFNNQDNYYIGLSDLQEEEVFTWQDGFEQGYNNWFNGAPNNSADHDFVVVDKSVGDRWQVVNYADSYPFVLEIADPCTWSRYEEFCCTDIGEDVMVAFRVIDRWGNYNDCMVTVEVQDKIAPQISCPPDLTIACEFDYASLDVFGVVRDSETDIQPLAIPEAYIINSSGPLFDGFSYDNCDVTVSVRSTPDFNQCGIGIIERTFTAEDAGGRTLSCIQQIKVQSETPFDGLNPLDLVWPEDIEEFGCENPEDYLPEVTGEPSFPGDDECDLVAVTYEDEVYSFNNTDGDACFKILRNWSVIDWCQIGVSEDYIWTDLQIIKINNSTPPEFTSSCDFVSNCTYDATCEEGYIELSMSASDDCTAEENLRWEYKIDKFNDGTFEYTLNSSDASGYYPIGQHLIKWTAEDKCGNKVSCEQTFLIENCKAHTAYCLRGVAVDLMPQDTNQDGLPDTGMIVVWADDLDAGSSHACENVDVTLSFSPDPNDTFKEFDCDDLGEQDIDLYAISQTSTGLVWSFCTASIDIQDNTGVCGIGDGRAQISGRIYTEEEQNLSLVSVDLEGSELDPLETDNSGEYLFENMPQGGSYSINPSRNFDPMNGISTMDLVLMQRHIIGYELLDSPYKMIAADVNNDKKLTSLDMLELRKMILDVQEGFSNNESWRFLVADHEFEDLEDPWTSSFPEKHDIDLLISDEYVDFIAMKIGDVSGDVSGFKDLPNLQSTFINTRNHSSVELYIEDKEFGAGEHLEINFYSSHDLKLLGYQFSLNFGEWVSSVDRIEPGVIDVTDENFGFHRIAEGTVTTSWHRNSAKNISKGETLFTIHVIADKGGRISDMIQLNSNPTKAEAYTGVGNVESLSLNFREENAGAKEFIELFQNAPNPFTNSTSIRFYLPGPELASISVYDLNGRMIKKIYGYYSDGMHELSIGPLDLAGKGVYYYTLRAGEFTATKKLVFLE